jgi:hypothetical protein
MNVAPEHNLKIHMLSTLGRVYVHRKKSNEKQMLYDHHYALLNQVTTMTPPNTKSYTSFKVCD